MTQYIVLYPISPDSGPLILPAPAGDPPVLVDDATLFSSEREFFTTEERARILMGMGVIAVAPARVVTAWEKHQAAEVLDTPPTDQPASAQAKEH